MRLRDIYKDSWTILDRKEKRQFTVLSLLDVIISVLDILSLALLLWIVQFYIQPQSAASHFLPSWISRRDSLSFIGIFFILFGLKNVSAYLITRAEFTFIGNVAVRLSRNNLANYQNGSYEDFVHIDSSVLIRKISLQPFEFCQFILSGIQQIITQTFLILLAIVAILLFNAKIFLLLLLILLPPVVLVFYVIKRRLTVAKSQIRSSNERSYQHLLDALKGYVEANVYGKNEFFLERFIGQRRKFSQYLFDSLALQNMPSRIIEIFAILGLFILIAIAHWTSANNSNALITVGAFMAAAYKIIPGIVKLINITGQIRAYEYSLNEILPAAHVTPNNNGSRDSIQSLELKNVSFRYQDLPVLHQFNLEVTQGDFLAITGESGKGKTTILNLVLGFLAPENGEILINNVSKSAAELRSFWPCISYVKQQSFLIHDTITRNISFQEESFDKPKLDCSIEISGVNGLIKIFPEGLDKVITENGKNISGGQQQRIALARAAYKDADLILLDEPFNELDEQSTEHLLKHFKKLAQSGKLIIMVTHDKQSLDYCNKIISLDG